MTYMLAQVRKRKQIDESAFALTLSSRDRRESVALMRARMEAAEIRSAFEDAAGR